MRSESKPTTRRYSPEFRERAVRMVRQLREETGETRGTIGRVAALHLQGASRREEAALAHARAGSLAASLHAHDTARLHLQAAIATGHPDPGDIHRTLGDVERAAGCYLEAVASYYAAAYGTDAGLERAIGDVYRRWGRWQLADAALIAAEAIAFPKSSPS